MTPADRTRALYYYFGWQGGTIHQLAKATGLKAQTILYEPLPIKTTSGFSAVRTCDCDWRVNKLAPTAQGNWEYWGNVIQGFWATGPLN